MINVASKREIDFALKTNRKGVSWETLGKCYSFWMPRSQQNQMKKFWEILCIVLCRDRVVYIFDIVGYGNQFGI